MKEGIDMARYGTKPCTIEAVQFLDTDESITELQDFTGAHLLISRSVPHHPKLIIETPHGELVANLGDFIIKDSGTGFTACSASVFHRKYELIE